MAFTLGLQATTRCNLQCSHCYLDRVGRDLDLAVLERAIEYGHLLGDAFLGLTGGEPTLHPEFAELAATVRLARGHRRLLLATNGARLVEHAAATAAFDVVGLSLFDAAGAERVQAFHAVCPPGVAFTMRPVTHRRTAEGRQPCGRHYRSAAVMDGLIYPCCVACGIAGAEGTPLTPGWEARLLGLRPPCERCVFGAQADPFGLCRFEEG